MATNVEPDDVELDIDSLKSFTIPKRKKSRTGRVLDLFQHG